MADRRGGEEVLKIQSFRTEFPKDIELITERRVIASHKKGCLLYDQEIYYKMVNLKSEMSFKFKQLIVQ